MRDSLPVRLGGLAANLARVSSISSNAENEAAAYSILDESKHFIEWTAAESETSTAAALAELQVTLALWQRNLKRDWQVEERRLMIGKQAKDFSNSVLQSSGLLEGK